MRNYYYRQIGNKEVIQRLDARYQSRQTDSGRVWDTSHGVSFLEPPPTKGLPEWCLLYHMSDEAEGGRSQKDGKPWRFIEQQEVLHLLDILSNKAVDFSLLAKPASIVLLERLLDTQAKLHWLGCLQWHIRIEDRLSCVCNEFDMCRTYASSSDNFEVSVGEDGDSMECVSLKRVIDIAIQQGLVAKFCSHCHAVDRSFQRCSRCRRARYCDIECQRAHWNTHCKICRSTQ